MRIKMAGATDVGLVRKMNQDSFHFDGTQGIVVVADGIGGRKGGEIGCSMAGKGVRDAYMKSELLRVEEINEFLTTAVERINMKVIDKGRENQELRGMGTTLNFLMFVGDKVHIAHIGDSRTYMYYKGHLWQLTVDHNVETFISHGWMRPENILPGTQEGALVRSIGRGEHCEVDIYDIKLREGQIFLTCSDGLSGIISDKRILRTIQKEENHLQRLPKLLIEEAKRGGGKDNIKVVVSQVVGR